MTTGRVSLIEVPAITGKVSFSLASSVEDAHVLRMHSQEAVRLDAEVDLTEAAARLALTSTLDCLKAISDSVRSLLSVISGCHSGGLTDLLRNYRFVCFCGAVCHKWPSGWLPVHFEWVHGCVEWPLSICVQLKKRVFL